MMRMKSGGNFRIALAAGCVALSVAGFLYARERNIPAWAAVPIVAAFLVEYSFYILPGFESVRAFLSRRFSHKELASWLACSAMAPYLIYSVPTGVFGRQGAAGLAAMIAAVCFWYALFAPRRIADLALLTLLAAIELSGVLKQIYVSPIPQRIDVLGHLMLIRTAVVVMLLIRRVQGVGFGFVPTEREFVIGLRHFVYFCAAGLPIAFALKMVHYNWEWTVLWKALLTFLGMLWVVSLSEEFFFRGLLQQWLAKWTGSPWLAVVTAAMLYGLSHITFRSFPNWRVSLLTAIAGLFFGRAYQQAGSIRASMVCHALVATVWRVVLS